MGLSFTPEMEIALPEYLIGTERLKNINKLITFNSAWKREAYEHLKKLLTKMEEIDASDIDIGGSTLDGKIWYRVQGRKFPDSKAKRYSSDEVVAILLSILSDDQKLILFERKNVDFSLGVNLGGNEVLYRFRGDIYYENNVLVANFRRVNRNLYPLEKLNIPNLVLKRLNLRHEKSGLILVTGITGSGKSTTLDSIINMNNNENEAHIVIISNPIEFIHKSIKCIIRHREVGGDVLSFRDGVIQALRQDPDIIVVAEMRDAPTIATVLEATDSGHKVFTTLHTSSAVESIHRIIAEFPPNEQERIRLRLADTLSVVISQKLVPDRENKLTLAKEILSVTDSVKAAIRNKNIGEIYQMITEGKKYGMVTMEQDLFNLYSKNIIDREIALDYSNSRRRMEQLLSYQTVNV
jgi:twitching motility protein PilT